MSNRTIAAIAGKNKEEIIEILKQKARESWGGQPGEDRATELESFLRKTLTNYSAVLGYTEEEILTKIEGRRDYSATNYYQEANFPCLENIEIFETTEQLRQKFPSHKFVCPMCHGISTDPNTCNTGLFMDKKKKKVCDWKSWGLFGTMGAGYKFVVKEDFLKHPIVHEIFMPIELKKEEQWKPKNPKPTRKK